MKKALFILLFLGLQTEAKPSFSCIYYEVVTSDGVLYCTQCNGLKAICHY